MKTKHLLVFVIIYNVGLFCKAQPALSKACLKSTYQRVCYDKTRVETPGYFILKSRILAKGNRNIKYPIRFKRKTNYLLSLCEGKESKVRINLYDKNEKLIASSHNEETGSLTDKISFFSKTSSDYYFSVNFYRGSSNCVIMYFGILR